MSLSLFFIEKLIGEVMKSSSLYVTQAWGNTDQPDFLNQAIAVSTSLKPLEVLSKIHLIEQKIGRRRYKKWGPRKIDIDILFFDQQIINKPSLTIPHVQLESRMFVLAPLNEIAPKFIHPVLNKSIEELYINSPDLLEVKKYND